ncbi:NYN domain-containing protein [Schizophyllum amplum]|uniref:NYN domain-containing protein n=1 Tax=Schizophyllum amplum TaxID=97359 RepID=A0A550CAA3_9AGAR|nr:NYN domain-containing protein [Auriculariopsis ampla]
MRVVGIFWDYENCQYIAGRTGFDVARNIEHQARGHGVVATFKAYMDVQQCATPAGLRSELQSSGVTLVDCPHNGQKNVVDLMLLTDMLVFALSQPGPVTVVLVSGDRDFAYTASVLRQRGHKVVLICHARPGPHRSLAAQVGECVDWNQEILKMKEESASPPKRKTTTEMHSQARQAFSAKRMVPEPLDVVMPAEDLEGTALDDQNDPGANIVSSSEEQAQSMVHTPEVERDELSSEDATASLTQDDNMFPSAGLRDTSGNDSSDCDSAWPPSPRVDAASSSSICSSLCLSPQKTSKDIPYATSSASYPSYAKARIVIFQPLIHVLQNHLRNNDPYPRRSIVGSELIGSDSGVYTRAGVAGFKEYSAAAEVAGIVVLGGWQAAAWITLTVQYGGIVDGQDDTQPSTRSVAVKQTTLTVARGDKPSTSSLPRSFIARHKVSRPAPVIQPHFRTLVDVLYEFRQAGTDRPLRSIVGLALVQRDRQVYKRADMKGFAEYVTRAYTEGLVRMGGKDGAAWITLDWAVQV